MVSWLTETSNKKVAAEPLLLSFLYPLCEKESIYDLLISSDFLHKLVNVWHLLLQLLNNGSMMYCSVLEARIPVAILPAISVMSYVVNKSRLS
uniref:Uncharacterized protein n=1 Tax=Populus trichocarpa TaxID=3694 RepID=A0A3N7G8T6_POPTR